jgi:dihydrofolate reductase
MRKLIISMNVTLDGFMAGPDCELDWHFQRWDSEMAESLSEELGKADTIILGRVTYSAMANYWPMRAACLSIPREDIAFADMMNNYTKVVFSKTLDQTNWKNSTLMKGNLRNEIEKLRRTPGRDMIVYGSGKLAHALVQENLVDEFRIWIHPVLLGTGKPFFRKINNRQNLVLVGRKAFSSGVIQLTYETLR